MANNQNFNYFNPQRYLLSQNWKNSIQALIGVQTTLSAVVSQVDPKINPGLIPVRIEAMQFLIRKIAQRLKEPTNDELKSGILLELTREISNFIKASNSTDGNTKFNEMLEIYGFDPYEISQISKKLIDYINQSFTSIQAASEEKVTVKSILSSPITQGIFKGVGAFSPAIGLSLFGAAAPVVGMLGGAALGIADKMGMNKYLKELSPFRKNLGTQNTAFVPGASGSASSIGGFSGAPGGSGVGTGNNSSTNALFTFFNKGAFQALWTRKVLEALGGNSDNKDEKKGFFSGFLKSIGDSFKTALTNVVRALPFILGPAIAAFGGWFAGRAIGNFKIGDKTVDNHVQGFFEKNIFKNIATDNAQANLDPETSTRMKLVSMGMDPKEAYTKTRAHFHPEEKEAPSVEIMSDKPSQLAIMNKNLQEYHNKLVDILQKDSQKLTFTPKVVRRKIEDPMLDYINMGLLANGN